MPPPLLYPYSILVEAKYTPCDGYCAHQSSGPASGPSSRYGPACLVSIFSPYDFSGHSPGVHPVSGKFSPYMAWILLQLLLRGDTASVMEARKVRGSCIQHTSESSLGLSKCHRSLVCCDFLSNSDSVASSRSPWEYLNLKIVLLAKVASQVVCQISSGDNVPAAVARHHYLDHIG